MLTINDSSERLDPLWIRCRTSKAKTPPTWQPRAFTWSGTRDRARWRAFGALR